MHWVPKKDGSGNRPTTLSDARKLGLLPSVTTILKVLAKPALQDWITRQAVMAVVTAPDMPGEAIDAKISRILESEQQQHAEAQAAADLGTKLHAALDNFFQGNEIPEDLRPWLMPAVAEIVRYGKVISTELPLVGEGFAGTTDLLLDAPECEWLFDFKSTKKLPTKGAWTEHVLQLSAYAAARTRMSEAASPTSKPIRTANIYISTVDQGLFVVCEHDPWQDAYLNGFVPLMQHWQWTNRYWPSGKKANPEYFVGLTSPEGVMPPRSLVNVEPAPIVVLPGEEKPKRKIAWSEGVPTPTPAAQP